MEGNTHFQPSKPLDTVHFQIQRTLESTKKTPIKASISFPKLHLKPLKQIKNIKAKRSSSSPAKIQSQIKLILKAVKNSPLRRASAPTAYPHKSPISMQTIGGSQNPVGIIQEEQHFNLSQIQQTFKKLDNFFVSKNKTYEQTKNLIEKQRDNEDIDEDDINLSLATLKNIYKEALTQNEEGVNNQIELLQDYLEDDLEIDNADDIIEDINKEAAKIFQNAKNIEQKKLKEIKEKFNLSFNSLKDFSKYIEEFSKVLSRLKSLPIQYRKDAIASTIKAFILSQPKYNKDNLNLFLDKINSTKGFFITKEQLKGIDDQLLKKVLSYQSEYISSDSIINKLQESGYKTIGLLKGALPDAQFNEPPSFVFKTGRENEREILALKIIDKIFEKDIDYLLNKTEITAARHKLKSSEAPKGIASRMINPDIEQKKLQETLDKYFDIKRLYQEARISNDFSSLQKLAKNNPKIDEWISFLEQDNTENIDSILQEISSFEKSVNDNETQILLKTLYNTLELKKDLINSKNALNALGGEKSIPILGFLDLIFCSYDSHINQVMIEDKEFFNFDFARFLAPSISFVNQGKTHVSFRSVFIDHPLAEKPIPQSLAQAIEKIDIQNFKNEMKSSGLIGDEKEMEQDAEKIKAFNDNFKASVEKQKEIAERYHLSISGPENNTQTYQKAFIDEFKKLKIKNYKKIHPKAFEQMLERIEKMQKAIKESRIHKTALPSLKEAFSIMYPDIQPFINALEKITPNPHEYVGVSKEKGKPTLTSLESIIEKTKHLLSDEEIKKLQTALSNLKAQASPFHHLSTTMELGI